MFFCFFWFCFVFGFFLYVSFPLFSICPLLVRLLLLLSPFLLGLFPTLLIPEMLGLPLNFILCTFSFFTPEVCEAPKIEGKFMIRHFFFPPWVSVYILRRVLGSFNKVKYLCSHTLKLFHPFLPINHPSYMPATPQSVYGSYQGKKTDKRIGETQDSKKC